MTSNRDEPSPILLVRRKGDADFALLISGWAARYSAAGHDFRDPRLVVRAEQGVASRDDKFLSDVIFQDGKLLFGENFPVCESDVSALIGHAGGFDVFARADGFGIQVRDEAERGQTLRGGGQVSVDVTVLVHAHPLCAELFQLLCQLFGEVELFFVLGCVPVSGSDWVSVFT